MPQPACSAHQRKVEGCHRVLYGGGGGVVLREHAESTTSTLWKYVSEQHQNFKDLLSVSCKVWKLAQVQRTDP